MNVESVHVVECPASLRPGVEAFYERYEENVRLAPSDEVFAALDNGTIVGAGRLAFENGHAVLRTIRVDAVYQRQGIGKRIVNALVGRLGGRPCFCIPFVHLEHFYSAFGFRRADAAEVPVFLVERANRYAKDGLVLTMLRGGRVARKEASKNS